MIRRRGVHAQAISRKVRRTSSVVVGYNCSDILYITFDLLALRSASPCAGRTRALHFQARFVRLWSQHSVSQPQRAHERHFLHRFVN